MVCLCENLASPTTSSPEADQSRDPCHKAAPCLRRLPQLYLHDTTTAAFRMASHDFCPKPFCFPDLSSLHFHITPEIKDCAKRGFRPFWNETEFSPCDGPI